MVLPISNADKDIQISVCVLKQREWLHPCETLVSYSTSPVLMTQQWMGCMPEIVFRRYHFRVEQCLPSILLVFLL